METSNHRSWGFTRAPAQRALVPAWTDAALETNDGDTALLAGELSASTSGDRRTSLAFGRGRSYGDSCLNSQGTLIDTRALDRFVAFDRERGVLTAEPGVTLAAVLRLIVPAGWFLPVSPGTSHATLGGAIANDVHGKNHHADGTFGRFVETFTLARSDGRRLICSPDENVDLFRATIGGLGLTGVVLEVTIRLLPIRSDRMLVRVDTFHGLEEFGLLADARRETHRYTVAWLDCAASGEGFARGVFLAANHDEIPGPLRPAADRTALSVPFAMPSRLLNRYSIRAFNATYFARHRPLDGHTADQHYQKFFYPLDAIGSWNRIYGAAGFHQYQFVVPPGREAALESILQRIVRSGMGSFLAVLKEFGDVPSPGMLSFPRPGLCLALDFADRGALTERLIRALDDEVREAGGAAYPAKDRLMTAEAFADYFPAADEFARHVDPGFSSDFWRRVHG